MTPKTNPFKDKNMPFAPSNQLSDDIDTTGEAINQVGKLSQEIFTSDDLIRVKLDLIEDHMRFLFSKGVFLKSPDLISDLEKINDRLRRLHELRNTAEYGSFMLQVQTTMQRVFERLP